MPPLVLWLPAEQVDDRVEQILATAATAPAVGALTGFLAGRRRDAAAARR